MWRVPSRLRRADQLGSVGGRLKAAEYPESPVPLFKGRTLNAIVMPNMM